MESFFFFGQPYHHYRTFMGYSIIHYTSDLSVQRDEMYPKEELHHHQTVYKKRKKCHLLIEVVFWVNEFLRIFIIIIKCKKFNFFASFWQYIAQSMNKSAAIQNCKSYSSLVDKDPSKSYGLMSFCIHRTGGCTEGSK